MSPLNPLKLFFIVGLSSFSGLAILMIKHADNRKVNASRINAVLIPNKLTTNPPNAAPKASIIDQVAPDSVLAVTRWFLGTIDGIIALLAGSKNPVRATSNNVSV